MRTFIVACLVLAAGAAGAWNDAGEQVWGAEKAGYVFLRVAR